MLGWFSGPFGWLVGQLRPVRAAGPEDGFLGTWILVENKNFEALLDHLGVGYVARTAALTLKPSIVFER